MVEKCRWQVVDGKIVRFWKDRWLDLARPLKDYCLFICGGGGSREEGL